MIDNKRVVVVLPAYNAAMTLEKTISEVSPGIVDEFVLVDLKHAVEGRHLRDGRFANPDDSDFIGFDERYFAEFGGQDLGEGRRAHPSRGAPSDDDDLADPIVAQFNVLGD